LIKYIEEYPNSSQWIVLISKQRLDLSAVYRVYRILQSQQSETLLSLKHVYYGIEE